MILKSLTSDLVVLRFYAKLNRYVDKYSIFDFFNVH